MHFMHLMCLHFTFLYFVDDHADVAMESASVGKGIEESFKEKMFFSQLLYSNMMHFSRCFNLEMYYFYDDK